jgi:hypothetical protein
VVQSEGSQIPLKVLAVVVRLQVAAESVAMPAIRAEYDLPLELVPLSAG